ncbi:MAG TPA: hypothetical protein VFB63_06470 [Bryobacteraceae bacterium]|nr:hypothetical protein [Bryobacteraceae bacterium]
MSNTQNKYELFNDGHNRWVLTEDYGEGNAPVFRTIQDAYNWLDDDGQPFEMLVHSLRRKPVGREREHEG